MTSAQPGMSGPGTWHLGMLLEPGSTGSLHMTLNDDLVRQSLRAPLPSGELLEPLWDSDSGMWPRLNPPFCPSP